MAISTLKARRKYRQRLLFGLAVKPLRLFCNPCGKYIPSDSEWKCGYCDTENCRTKLYSFLRKCQKCKRPPKAFICPHCKELNFLTKERDATHLAWNIQTVAPPAIATGAKMPNGRKDRQDVEIEKLNAELAMVKNSIEFKEKSAHTRHDKSLMEFEINTIGAKMALKRRRAEYAVEVKNDEDLMKQWDEMSVSWLEHQSLIPPT